MRLVIATPFLESRGGMERVVMKIAQRFGAKIHCVAYDPERTYEEFRALDVEAAKPGSLSKLPLGKRVASAMDVGNHFFNLKLSDYDLINAHQTPSEWVRNRNSPVLWYCHSPNREAFDLYEFRMKKRNPLSKAVFWSSIQAYKRFEFMTVPKIEYIFTNSRNSQERIKRYLKRDSEVLYPGVDAQKFSCRGYEDFFLYPARITPEKEIEYAIEAFKFFKSHMGAQGKDWKLFIAGNLSERPEHQAYYRKIKAMATADIFIEKNVDEARLLDLYSRCRAVLYTPVNEDFGLIPGEAMAASKPCIARNEGGPRETIRNGEDGFLVDSIWDMAAKMEALAKNPERSQKMGRAGRAKVEKEFTWERFMKRFEEKASELIAKRPS